MKIVALAILCWMIHSCNSGRTENTDVKPLYTDTIPMQEIKGNFLESSAQIIDSNAITVFMNEHKKFKAFQSDIRRFYRNRQYSFAWHIHQSMIEQGSILFNRVIQIKDNGIQEEVPYLEEFDNLIDYENADIIQRELMLTAQYLFYAKKVIGGITVNESKESEWFLPRPRRDYVAMLDTLLSKNNDAYPRILYPQYYKLRDKLKQYFTVSENATWISIPIQRKKLKLGDSSAIIGKIRTKLFLSHDLRTDNGNFKYDSSLFSGVQEFQRRYGLTEDGIIGQEVMKKMNEPIDRRIEQIIINMERCRWLSNTHEKEYIVINIPDFKLTLYRNDSAIFNCKVVVGKLKNKTVNFKGDMTQIVLNPYWYIPESILAKEIYPALEKNPNYLKENNMEWFQGKIRQKPGQENALGRIKFQLPNSFNIYLHDTPSKSLFAAQKRTFSHGCIRLEKPEDLALLLLEQNANWNMDMLKNAIETEKEQFLTLPNPVPVYIVYFTAFVDEMGKLNIRNDIYGRDSVLSKMIFSKKPSY
ncbi:MAG: L,D-transpeptidase family protein [Chitinophagaceae bacterium]